ncbi:MAG: DNA repair exonuclease [Clostridia bacterium]|nr:DNA repair exonuclease [Clostridia bacterium]
MKFIHIADMHFDCPFINLSEKEMLGDLRRLEQRKIFKKIIEYIKENKIEYFFISGDLYEHQYIKQSTIEYINHLFREIPETKVYIAPGNHDPYIKNSYYNKYQWEKNVKIFSSTIEKVETKEANIYGYGFDDFYCRNCGIEEIEIEKGTKPNLLIIHGTLDGASIEEKQYNSISKKQLEEKGFDYVALGHIHKSNYQTTKNQKIIYPGSTAALGFDEMGQHGMIVGELTEGNLKLEFISLDEEQFVKKEIEVTNLISKEELIEAINEIEVQNKEYVEIVLSGNRNFEINRYDILKYILNNRIIKIKDKTKIAYDLEKIANQNTLKGIFAQKMLNKLKSENITQEEKEMIEKAIEIGLEALE